MNTYRITNLTSGQDMGTYQGEDEDAALRAMVADAGASELDAPSDWLVEDTADGPGSRYRRTVDRSDGSTTYEERA